MSEFLRIVIAIILILHGVGHILAIFPIVGKKLSPTHSSNSWLLTKLIGNTGTYVVAFIIWPLALIGFVAGGFGLLGWFVPQAWWPSLTVGAAIISLLGLGLFWNAFPFFFPNKVGVIVVDVLALLSFLWT